MKIHFKESFIVALALVVSASLFSAEKKKAIQKLTSKEKSEEVAQKIPESTSSDTVNVHSLGLGIGQTFLQGKFDKHGEDKITFDLYYNYSASHSFDLLANVHYSEHSFLQKKVTLPGLAIGIKSKLFNFDSFAPFALAGLGFYRPTVTRAVYNIMTESKAKVTFGTHFGAGAELRLNRHASMALLGHYHNPFDIKQELGPEVEGSYFKLLLVGFYSF